MVGRLLQTGMFKWCHHTKMPLLLPYYWWLQNVKTDHEKSWPVSVLPEKNFGLILKNKMAAIASYFKIIKIPYPIKKALYLPYHCY